MPTTSPLSALKDLQIEAAIATAPGNDVEGHPAIEIGAPRTTTDLDELFARRELIKKVVVVAEGIDKLKVIHAGMVQLQEQAAARGRGAAKIEKAIALVQEMREKIGALILGAM